MNGKGLVKLVFFNVLLSFLNIVLFSSAFLNLDMTGKNAFTTAFGAMVIVVSIILFFYGNFKILSGKGPKKALPVNDKDLKTLDDCKAAIYFYIANNVDTYSKHLKETISQINRMQKKKASIKNMLFERFTENELSYNKFYGAVESVENIMFLNIKSLLNRINMFDEEEYEEMLSKKNNNSYKFEKTDKFIESMKDLYDEYMHFVEKSVENNEEILLRLDKLMLEISKLNELNGDEIEDINALREIDDLIKDAKWYK